LMNSKYYKSNPEKYNTRYCDAL